MLSWRAKKNILWFLAVIATDGPSYMAFLGLMAGRSMLNKRELGIL